MFDTEWNMKDALRVRGEECFEEGIAIGEAKGRAEGEARGEAKGRAEGAFAAVVENVRSLMANYKLSVQDALNALNIPPADRPAILAAL